jgi:phosphoribosylglycinamide formyltransferase 2
VRARDAGGVIETSFCEPIGHLQVAGDYVESWQPQAMSAVALEKARAIAAAVTGSLGGRGLFGVELFVKGDQVWFSEVSPRPHDTGLGDAVLAALLGIRTARARHPRPARRYPPARAGRFGGDLRRQRRQGYRVRRHRRSARRSRAATCACSANPRPSANAAWAWRWPTATMWHVARARAKLAASRVRPVAG